MIQTDVLIIGAGTAGEYAASKCAGNGRKVVLVERSRVVGACVFNACIPTEAMVHAACTWREMRRADFFGNNSGEHGMSGLTRRQRNNIAGIPLPGP